MSDPPLIIICSSISTLLPFLAFAMSAKYSNEHFSSLKLLWIFFALAAGTEIILFILSSSKTPSTWITHIYTLIEYVLITAVLASWQPRTTSAKIMWLSLPVYVFLFMLAKIAGLESFSANTNNYITRPLALFLLSTFVFITLHGLWRQSPINLNRDYRFWMLLAMAIYYSASLVLFAFMFTKSLELLIALFKIHAAVNIAHNILFTIGVLKVRAAQRAALQPTSS